MRIIDADTLEEKLKRKRVSKGLSTNRIEIMIHVHAVEDCLEIVRNMPTIDAEPVKHGHWIIIDDTEKFLAKCSVCGRVEDTRWIADFPYCHCGAKMDGGTE